MAGGTVTALDVTGKGTAITLKEGLGIFLLHYDFLLLF